MIDSAMRRFAEHGLRGTRLADVAADAGVTKAAIFRYFASKDDLFFETHRRATRMLAEYLDAPADIVRQGFYESLRYWLRSDHLLSQDSVPYRVYLLGVSATEISLQGRISRFLLTEDPEKTLDFVDFGKANGDVRPELDPYVVAAVLDWVEDGVQRSITSEELDRGLFHKEASSDEDRRRIIDTVIEILRHGLDPEPRDVASGVTASVDRR